MRQQVCQNDYRTFCRFFAPLVAELSRKNSEMTRYYGVQCATCHIPIALAAYKPNEGTDYRVPSSLFPAPSAAVGTCIARTIVYFLTGRTEFRYFTRLEPPRELRVAALARGRIGKDLSFSELCVLHHVGTVSQETTFSDTWR